MIVLIALIVGSTPRRTIEYTRSGSVVEPTPATKNVMTKSSNDIVNARSAAATTPGRICGSVTRKNVVSGSAPRSIAASSRSRPVPCRRAKTTTATNEMLNATCAIVIVPRPSLVPEAANRTRSEIPTTISGVTMGR